MDNWNNEQFSDFLEGERKNCYWFWFKGKITGKYEWNGIRLQNGFNHCFNILTEKYMRGLKEGKYNGQTKAEFEKNKVRVSDIWIKSGADIEKAKSLSMTQANRITDEWKAINRAMCAREMGYEEIFEIFFHRAYELGSVSKLEYREYKLDKLGI